MINLALACALLLVVGCSGGGAAGSAATGGGGGSSATQSGGSAGTGGGVGNLGGSVNEDLGSSPDRWTQSICPASTEPGVLTLSFADGSCATFTYKSSLFYHGAFLVESTEGRRLDIEMLPDHSAAESVALHAFPGGAPVSTSYCYIYGFKSLCQGVDVSPGASRHFAFRDVLVKSAFMAMPEVLINGSLDLDDTPQTNRFVVDRAACGPATEVGRYGGCGPQVLGDFALVDQLTTDNRNSPCQLSLSNGTLSLQTGDSTLEATLDAEQEDALTVTVNAQIFYSYTLSVSTRFPNSNQPAKVLKLHVMNDGIDSVTATHRDTVGAPFQTTTCRGQTLDQPWNHVWP